MVEGSVAGHTMTQHGRAAEARQGWKTLATGYVTQRYQMIFPAKGILRSCPVERCLGRAMTRTGMQVHFLYPHVLDTVVIL